MKNISEIERPFKSVQRLASKEPLSDHYKNKLKEEFDILESKYVTFLGKIENAIIASNDPSTSESISDLSEIKNDLQNIMGKAKKYLGSETNEIILYISWLYYTKNLLKNGNKTGHSNLKKQWLIKLIG